MINVIIRFGLEKWFKVGVWNSVEFKKLGFCRVVGIKKRFKKYFMIVLGLFLNVFVFV